jgi:TolB-like protein/class 3 adenylate cyclase
MTDQEVRPKHRLAAIMATDVVGYSKLMQSDETAALAALAEIQNATQQQIELHQGRIANTAGDSVLAEFGSAVEAVNCAMALQRQLTSQEGKDLQLRIGIHLGDVVDKAGDLFGSAVNIAARLEGIAQPGDIVVSAAVRDAIAGKLTASFSDLGLKSLKNIEEPLRAYALSPRTGSPLLVTSRTGEALLLPNKPSIAVLPFENLSGDREQEYFADGMVEEILTALSRMRWLFVIARNSSFAYKGRAVDVKVGRELGVRYILEGSVRKAGNRLRITGQLIDTSTGAHLWADRFEGGLEDVFDLQDQVTASVVGAISPRLEQAEIDRAKRKPTESLDAYDHYLRGLAAFHQWSKLSNQEALPLFYRTIELDPTFASAYAMAAQCYDQRALSGWIIDRGTEIAETARLARQAIIYGKDDAVALSIGGFCIAILGNELTYGSALIERALVLDPNLAAGWHQSGWIKVVLGEPEAGIERLARAMRLSPHDPYLFGMRTATGLGHFVAGRYPEAVSWAESAITSNPEFSPGLRLLAASNAMAGRHEQAQRAIARLRLLYAEPRIADLKNIVPTWASKDFKRYEEALRLAGLPE